ncbi:MAG: membrane fusion protein (multidrug efflux system) [Rickettsiales bacterium]|jgi:membrane fusion protein (multidrug efflux system)
MNNFKPHFKTLFATFFLTFLVTVFLTAILYFLWIKPNQAIENNNHNTNSQTAPKPAIAVSAFKIYEQKIDLFVDLPGRISSNIEAHIRPQAEGIIRQVKFIEGSFVEKDQPLYDIDPTIYQASYQSAKRNLETLTAKQKRYKELAKINGVSKQDLDNIESEFQSAKSDFSLAQRELEYTQVLAPISGYIGKSHVVEGALVTGNQSDILATITQLEPIRVDMQIPSREAIALGNIKDIPVSLTSEGSDFKGEGILQFSEIFANPETDAVFLRAIFANQEHRLIPGMFVGARLHPKPFSAVIVPQRATNRGPSGDLIVWIINEENIVKPRNIKATQTYQDFWIVQSGLKDGENIVFEGFQKIADGAKVNPTFIKQEMPKEEMPKEEMPKEEMPKEEMPKEENSSKPIQKNEDKK